MCVCVCVCVCVCAYVCVLIGKWRTGVSANEIQWSEELEQRVSGDGEANEGLTNNNLNIVNI